VTQAGSGGRIPAKRRRLVTEIRQPAPIRAETGAIPRGSDLVFRPAQEDFMVRFAIVVAALALLSGTASAQGRIEKGPIKPVAASDAQKMFNTYCAVCHGKEGTANGPAAASLNKAPADLSKISARNNGTFPEVHVKRYIEGVDEVAAHGSRDMPMWGDLFNSLDRNTTQIRVQALSDYIKTMQTK